MLQQIQRHIEATLTTMNFDYEFIQLSQVSVNQYDFYYMIDGHQSAIEVVVCQDHYSHIFSVYLGGYNYCGFAAGNSLFNAINNFLSTNQETVDRYMAGDFAYTA